MSRQKSSGGQEITAADYDIRNLLTTEVANF